MEIGRSNTPYNIRRESKSQNSPSYSLVLPSEFIQATNELLDALTLDDWAVTTTPGQTSIFPRHNESIITEISVSDLSDEQSTGLVAFRGKINTLGWTQKVEIWTSEGTVSVITGQAAKHLASRVDEIASAKQLEEKNQAAMIERAEDEGFGSASFPSSK